MTKVDRLLSIATDIAVVIVLFAAYLGYSDDNVLSSILFVLLAILLRLERRRL